MDQKKSILNVSVSIAFKVITMIMVIIVKRFLIQFCGNEVNGLNALYLSIVGFLSVAELGVGSAITFCMYRPIVQGDNDRVSALYGLFSRLYKIIGGVILLVGFVITPFIHYFAADYVLLDINLQITFVLMLVSVVVTYGYGAKTALINAYKNNYITTAITSGGIILQYILQIIVLLLTKSFAWYLACRSIAAVAQWIVTDIVARKKYQHIISNRQKIDSEAGQEVKRNIKAMFIHKIGTLLVNTADSVIISAFVGVVALGAYSNYSTILVSMVGVLQLVFSSLTSVLGHLYVEKDKQITQRYHDVFYLLNFVIGVVFFLGYYAIIDDLIAVLFSADLIAAKSVSFVVTLNGFVQFMRTSTLVFKDATGTFYYDRWKPVAEGIANIVLSIIFVKWIGVVGVIAATIVTNLVICHIVEPYVLYKKAFEMKPGKFYLKNYSIIMLFAAALVLLHCCLVQFESHWAMLYVNGCISVGISAAVCVLVFAWNRALVRNMKQMIKKAVSR